MGYIRRGLFRDEDDGHPSVLSDSGLDHPLIDGQLCSVSYHSTFSGSSRILSSSRTCFSAQQAMSMDVKKVLPHFSTPVTVERSRRGKQGLPKNRRRKSSSGTSVSLVIRRRSRFSSRSVTGAASPAWVSSSFSSTCCSFISINGLVAVKIVNLP